MVVKFFRVVCVLAFLLGCHFTVTADFWKTNSAHDQRMRKQRQMAFCTASESSDHSGCRCGTLRNFTLGNGNETPWQITASGPRSGSGIPGTITWSIMPDGTPVPDVSNGGAAGPSNFNEFLSTTFTGGVTGEELIEQSFNRWDELSGLSFVREDDDGSPFSNFTLNGVIGVRGDIRIGGRQIDDPGNILAANFFPDDGGDMIVDTSESGFFGSANNNFRAFRNVIMHELGHAIGIDHVISSTDRLLLAPTIDLSFDGPQLDEVRAIQFFFGDAFEETNNGLGNETVPTATDLGSISPGGMLAVGEDADVPTQAIAPTATDFVSISGADDVDVYSFTISTSSILDITLTPLGGVFSQGGAGSFDANSRVDLSLSLFDSDGQSLLGSSNLTGLGGTETLSSILLDPGTYYTQITGVEDTIQLYSLELTSEPSALKGDTNLSGAVNFADIPAFISVLQAGTFQVEADTNCDTIVNFADIPAFIAILLGT